MRNHFYLIFFLIFSCAHSLLGQSEQTGPFSDKQFSGLKLRSLGPGLMSGRIADIAIHPQDDNTWYVAVGSGGVWKTVNAGVTWQPLFDKQSSYSTGCVTIDPHNPQVIWVGTGENVGGRHIGYGDGIYRSDDGGKTWKNKGLKNSEHISKIIIHPDNSSVIWAAVQGPLWTKGGERGLFKSSDGGDTWKRVLGDTEWTGVTDIVIDPRKPNRLYAATWQRHRTVAAYMGGGPESGIHRSTDGGETWERLKNGLPKSNMGKIGLAISPQQPDILYTAIELDRRTGGVYRSPDRGTTWEKRSDAVSGATGPHYYQELYASPHQFERLYLVDVRMQVSDDGGKNFRRMKEEYKHSDNHALAFRTDDPDYLLVGTDGGIYESFDLAKNWRFIDNLPLTQFYKVAVDDAAPFYNIYGGTQDNSTQGGPSRTDNVHGIQNSDWKIVLNWDGHQPATEPGNPDIMYAERQEGNLSRIDLKTGEVVDIQPQPGPDEPYERFNWDAPILVSPHQPSRIYFASQRVWRSDNRGDEWKAISGDLTKNQNRLTLPIMGKMQSWDEAWDVLAMSNYNTITSLAESPKQEGLLYAGTDDGHIQITEDGGANWRKVNVSQLPGVPATAFVNDIKADLHDASTVYVALDNHKYGDFKPYLFKSSNKGKTWQSVSGNLPDRTLVWRVVQDHIKPGLLFAATEFGIYFTINGGGRWTKLTGGVPTISFRDLAIQRRENDLVGASFGRGFYVFDDYSVLREVTEDNLAAEANLFSTRKAWWYIPRPKLGFEGIRGDQGASHFVAPNPMFGAVFTYHLKADLSTKKEIRKEKEKALKKANQDITFPGWEEVEAEHKETPPEIWLTVEDAEGSIIRRIKGPTKKGFHRVAWDLRYPAPNALRLNPPKEKPMFGGAPTGQMAAPGTYTVRLSKQVGGVITPLSEPQTFEVQRLYQGTLPGASTESVAAFWKSYDRVTRIHSGLQLDLAHAKKKAKIMKKALWHSNGDNELSKDIHQLSAALFDIDVALNGMNSKRQIGEKTKPTIGERLFAINRGITRSTYGPTATHQQTMEILQTELAEIEKQFNRQSAVMKVLIKKLTEIGAPLIEGELLED